DSRGESAVKYPFAPENRARSSHAHHFTADPIRPQAAGEEDEGTGAAGLSAAAGRLRPRLYHHPEEAELGTPEGGPGAADLPPGGDRLYSGYRPQPAGALGGPDPRRPRQRSPRCPLPRGPRHSRHGRRQGAQAGPLEVRRQAREGEEGLAVPRRARIQKRVILPDPVYTHEGVAKFVNVVMQRGKRSTAERVVYGSLDRIRKVAKKDPIEVFDSALKNATPVLEVKPR